MRTMSIRELRESLPMISEIVEKSGEVLLTRHGHALVRLVPLNPSRSAPTHADLRASMPSMPVPSEDLVRAGRERG